MSFFQNPPKRRVRARGLQRRPCRPGPLTRHAAHKILAQVLYLQARCPQRAGFQKNQKEAGLT